MANSSIYIPPNKPPKVKKVSDGLPKLKKCTCGMFFPKEDGIEYKIYLHEGKMKRNYVCSETCLQYTQHQLVGQGRFSRIRRVRANVHIFNATDTYMGTTTLSQTIPVIVDASTGLMTIRQTFINE